MSRELEIRAKAFQVRFSMLNNWIKKLHENCTVKEWIINKKYCSIGVYGLGDPGERLVEELNSAEEFRIDYIADKREILQGGTYMDIPVIDPQAMCCYDKTDLVIITLPFYRDSIKKEIAEIDIDADIIGLDEIINEM